MFQKVKIEVCPESTLMDETCKILISDLVPYQKVTVLAIIRNYEDNVVYHSYVEMVSDYLGNLNVDESFSYKGTYTGIETMGLFWSAIQAPGQRKGMALYKRIVNEPIEWKLLVIDGTIDEKFIENIVVFVRNGNSIHDYDSKKLTSTGSSNILAIGTAKRFYCYPEDVKIIELDGLIKGTVLFPKHLEKKSKMGKSDLPIENGVKVSNKGIIDIHGGIVVKNFRAALLAQRGYVVFNLAYYERGNRKEIDTNLSYFIDGVDFMLSDDFPAYFDKEAGLGLIGRCKGGCLSLDLAAFYPKNVFRAIVVANSTCFHRLGSYKRDINGDSISKSFDLNEPLLIRDEDVYMAKGLSQWFLSKSLEEREKFCIPVEKINAQILFIYGLNNNSVGIENLYYMVDRLVKAGKNNYRCLLYPGAGHMIDPPIFPLCPMGYWPILKVLFSFGGDHKLHHQAQLDSWKHILDFFKMNLK